MCDFFSFVSDGHGHVYYFDAKQRSDEHIMRAWRADSHTSIACCYLEYSDADDHVNKYEYRNGELVIDQLNTWNDVARVRSWLAEFVRTEDFEAICLEVVSKDGHTLRFIQEQTPAICLAAVKQNGIALVYVKEQTPEICLAAVQRDSGALAYVINPTPKIIQAALR